MSATDDLTALAANGFTKYLGLEYTEAGPDGVVATFAITPDLHQPYGIVHGGVWATVIETLASMSGALWLGDRGQVVGVNNQTDFLRAARDGVVTARTTPVHRGRLQQLWLVELTGEDGKLLARGQVRLQNLEDTARLAKG